MYLNNFCLVFKFIDPVFCTLSIVCYLFVEFENKIINDLCRQGQILSGKIKANASMSAKGQAIDKPTGRTLPNDANFSLTVKSDAGLEA